MHLFMKQCRYEGAQGRFSVPFHDRQQQKRKQSTGRYAQRLGKGLASPQRLGTYIGTVRLTTAIQKKSDIRQNGMYGQGNKACTGGQATAVALLPDPNLSQPSGVTVQI